MQIAEAQINGGFSNVPRFLKDKGLLKESPHSEKINWKAIAHQLGINVGVIGQRYL
jgi:hypothetical protein